MVTEAVYLQSMAHDVSTKFTESLEKLRPELRQDPFLIRMLLESATREKRLEHAR